MENEIQPKPKRDETLNTLLLVSFIFMLITTISLGFLLIPLAWCIPMTVSCYRCYEENRRPSIAFAVCTLIFVSLVAGVLMIVSSSEVNQNNQ